MFYYILYDQRRGGFEEEPVAGHADLRVLAKDENSNTKQSKPIATIIMTLLLIIIMNMNI